VVRAMTGGAITGGAKAAARHGTMAAFPLSAPGRYHAPNTSRDEHP
jgi:hypothetical protein